MGIKPTWQSKLTGPEAVVNHEVVCQTGAKPLAAYFWHILRRGGDDPAMAATYDRWWGWRPPQLGTISGEAG